MKPTKDNLITLNGLFIVCLIIANVVTAKVINTGEYYSMCEHHVLPFFGEYYFAYIPKEDGRILGISKIARVVGYCAARLQLQERLAVEIINMLSGALEGMHYGMAILMKGQHLCKTMRGVKNPGNMCVTHYTGAFNSSKSPTFQREFLELVKLQSDG